MFLLIKRLDRAFQRLGQSTELFKHLVERRSFSNTWSIDGAFQTLGRATELFKHLVKLLKSSEVELMKVIKILSKRKDVNKIVKAKIKNADLTDTGKPSDTPTYMNQSLCGFYKFLWSKFRKLWQNKYIDFV